MRVLNNMGCDFLQGYRNGQQQAENNPIMMFFIVLVVLLFVALYFIQSGLDYQFLLGKECNRMDWKGNNVSFRTFRKIVGLNIRM